MIKDDDVLKVICRSFEACERCAKMFAMPYCDCCMYHCNENEQCKFCSGCGTNHVHFKNYLSAANFIIEDGEFSAENMKEIMQIICNEMDSCEQCKKLFDMSCCLNDCGFDDKCVNCKSSGARSENFKKIRRVFDVDIHNLLCKLKES